MEGAQKCRNQYYNVLWTSKEQKIREHVHIWNCWWPRIDNFSLLLTLLNKPKLRRFCKQRQKSQTTKSCSLPWRKHHINWTWQSVCENLDLCRLLSQTQCCTYMCIKSRFSCADPSISYNKNYVNQCPTRHGLFIFVPVTRCLDQRC